MSTLRRFAAIALILSFTAPLFGCGESSTGPSFAGPNIEGHWRGSFRDADVLMSLSQNGNMITGTITVGRRDYDLTGTIDESGKFDWGATDTLPNLCQAMSSGSSDFVVLSKASLMSGVARRTTRNGPQNDPCNSSRAQVENGSMELEKI